MKNLWRAFNLVLPHHVMVFWYGFSTLALAVFGSAPLAMAFIRKRHRHEPKDALGIYVDHLLAGFFGEGSGYLWELCTIILILSRLKSVLDFVNTYIASWLAQRLRTEAMQRVVERLLTLDRSYFDKQKTGELVSRIVSDGDNLRKTVKIDFLKQRFMVIALIVLADYFDWFLFCVGTIGTPHVFWPLTRVIENVTRKNSACLMWGTPETVLTSCAHVLKRKENLSGNAAAC